MDRDPTLPRSGSPLSPTPGPRPPGAGTAAGPAWAGPSAHLEAAGAVGRARGVRGVEPGTRQAARPRRPILPSEVEEHAGVGLCWRRRHFHRHGPHVPRDRPLVGLGEPRGDNLQGEWGCSARRGWGRGSEVWGDGTPGSQFQPSWASASPLERGLGQARAAHSRPRPRVPSAWGPRGPPYLLSGEGRVGGAEKRLGPGPGLQQQEGLGPGAQGGVGRRVAAHLLDAEVLRGVQELQGGRQEQGVRGALVTAH